MHVDCTSHWRHCREGYFLCTHSLLLLKITSPSSLSHFIQRRKDRVFLPKKQTVFASELKIIWIPEQRQGHVCKSPERLTEEKEKRFSALHCNATQRSESLWLGSLPRAEAVLRVHGQLSLATFFVAPSFASEQRIGMIIHPHSVLQKSKFKHAGHLRTFLTDEPREEFLLTFCGLQTLISLKQTQTSALFNFIIPQGSLLCPSQ